MCLVRRRRWCDTGLDCEGHSSAVCSQPVPPSQHYHPPSMEEQPLGQGDRRSTAATRSRSCGGTARSCQPDAILPPSEQINPFKVNGNIKFNKVDEQIYTYVSPKVKNNIQFKLIWKMTPLWNRISVRYCVLLSSAVTYYCSYLVDSYMHRRKQFTSSTIRYLMKPFLQEKDHLRVSSSFR